MLMPANGTEEFAGSLEDLDELISNAFAREIWSCDRLCSQDNDHCKNLIASHLPTFTPKNPCLNWLGLEEKMLLIYFAVHRKQYKKASKIRGHNRVTRPFFMTSKRTKCTTSYSASL